MGGMFSVDAATINSYTNISFITGDVAVRPKTAQVKKNFYKRCLNLVKKCHLNPYKLRWCSKSLESFEIEVLFKMKFDTSDNLRTELIANWL